MKVDIKEIARSLIHDYNWRSNSANIEDAITEAILEQINPFPINLTNRVIQEMQELEHPEPRNVEEYNERYGLGEGE